MCWVMWIENHNILGTLLYHMEVVIYSYRLRFITMFGWIQWNFTWFIYQMKYIVHLSGYRKMTRDNRHTVKSRSMKTWLVKAKSHKDNHWPCSWPVDNSEIVLQVLGTNIIEMKGKIFSVKYCIKYRIKRKSCDALYTAYVCTQLFSVEAVVQHSEDILHNSTCSSFEGSEKIVCFFL